MPQIRISAAKGLVQETTAISGVHRVSVQDDTVVSGAGIHTLQEVITLPSTLTDEKVVGKASFTVPQGAVLLEASLVVLKAGLGAGGVGINVCFGAAGTAVGGNAVTTTEFLGAGASGEIPAGDIAIGTGAVAGQTAQALSGPLATGVAGAATIYINDAGDNGAVTGNTPQVLLTIKYVGKAPVAA